MNGALAYPLTYMLRYIVTIGSIASADCGSMDALMPPSCSVRCTIACMHTYTPRPYNFKKLSGQMCNPVPERCLYRDPFKAGTRVGTSAWTRSRHVSNLIIFATTCWALKQYMPSKSDGMLVILANAVTYICFTHLPNFHSSNS